MSRTLSKEDTVLMMTSDPESMFRRNMFTLSSRKEDSLLVGKPGGEEGVVKSRHTHTYYYTH